MVQERRRKAGISLQRCADQRKRFGERLLVAQNAEQMERIEMIGPRLEQLQIQAFSGGKIPLAMQIGGLIEHLSQILHWRLPAALAQRIEGQPPTLRTLAQDLRCVLLRR